MTQDLVSGYAAYASADELSAAEQAPATPIVAGLIVAGAGVAGFGAGFGVGETIHHNC